MSGTFESRFDAEYEGEIPDSVDTAALDRMETVAYLFDESVKIPGIGVRVGVDPILGAIPVAGDALSAFCSLYIVAESAYLGVSFTTLLGMLANIAVDLGGGSIPYVGTVFDAVWKANRRNVELALADLAETVTDSGPAATDGGTDPGNGGVDIPVDTDF